VLGYEFAGLNCEGERQNEKDEGLSAGGSHLLIPATREAKIRRTMV
jgi:hypothetical protein